MQNGYRGSRFLWISALTLLVKRFDLALQFQQHGLALAVERLGRGDLDPAFAQAILIDVETFLVVETDADVVLEHLGVVVGAARIDGEPVRQWGEGGGIVHGSPLSTKCDDRTTVVRDAQCDRVHLAFPPAVKHWYRGKHFFQSGMLVLFA